MSERPTWDEYFKKIVLATSERSACDRLHVGCILVKDNRIISQGYNGFLPGCPHESVVRDNHEQAVLHAEQNALMDCAKRGASCNGATAYVTHYPCIICCRLLLAAGIKQIKYINDYKNDELVQHFCDMCQVSLININNLKNKNVAIRPVINKENTSQQESWQCKICTIMNPHVNKICMMCMSTRILTEI
jgi:dCMP deaminase